MVGRGEACIRPGLGVGEDGRDRCLHVALGAARVAVECGRHALHVSRRRVARDQALNQLSADERADARLTHEGTDRELQAGLAVVAGWHRDAEKSRAAGFVPGRARAHRANHRVGWPGGRAGCQSPAGEHPRELGHVGLGVGRLRRAVDQHGRTVEVEFLQADREQLHHLARIVFVGLAAGGRVALVVVQKAQVSAHRGRLRDEGEQVAVVAEGVGFEPVEKRARREAAIGQHDSVQRDHEDLAQRQRDPLAQHIGARDQLAPHRARDARAVDAGEVGRRGLVVVGAHPVDMALAARQRVLLIDPALHAERANVLDVGCCSTEGRLAEHA